MIDIMSVLHSTESSGQLVASDEEVHQAILLLLSHLPGTTLVFDGIDECSDSAAFLAKLQHLCFHTSTKALLFSRPSLDIPHTFSRFMTFDLTQRHNREDIHQYLVPEIQSLQEQSLIPAELPLAKVVATLVSRSLGMFLWASLMIRYLNCRALSPRERRDAIFAVDVVEGIEGLYNTILKTLGRAYAAQRTKAQRVFALLVVAERPLTVAELQFALGVQPGRATDQDSLIRDLGQHLPTICGALVEVSDHAVVRFIHLSFREFLTDESENAVKTPFSVDPAGAHLDAAATCLSCIVYDIPRGPLMRTGTTALEERLFLGAVFPLLPYSLFWTRHAAEGMRLAAKWGEKGAAGRRLGQLVSLVATFMVNKFCVTTWVEAAWSFGAAPSVNDMLKELADVESTSLHLALHAPARWLPDLKELGADLDRLCREWGHLLQCEPWSIWQSSVTAFTKSRFLHQATDTIVSSFAPSGTNSDSTEGKDGQLGHSILVQTQVSSSGHVLGIISVSPSL